MNSAHLLHPLRSSDQQSLDEFQEILKLDGPAGLPYLNARVPLRYTGIYQLEDGVLHNRYLFDKQGQVLPEALAAVPLGDSFCQFVLRDGFFATSCSGSDQRLNGHLYQGVVNAYVGLPLRDNRAELYGTLCHFDEQALDLPAQEFDFLHQVCKLLPRYLSKRVAVSV